MLQRLTYVIQDMADHITITQLATRWSLTDDGTLTIDGIPTQNVVKLISVVDIFHGPINRH